MKDLPTICKCRVCNEMSLYFDENGICKQCLDSLKKDAHELSKEIAKTFNLKLQ